MEEWCQQCNFGWKSQKMHCRSTSYSQAELKNGDVCENKMLSSWNEQYEQYLATCLKISSCRWTPLSPSLLRRNITQLEFFPYIYVLGQSVHCLWIWILSWAVDRWTTDLWRVIDVKAASAIDYEWQANFVELGSVCMNFCIQMGFISEVCTITLQGGGKKMRSPLSLLWNVLSMYCIIYCRL